MLKYGVSPEDTAKQLRGLAQDATNLAGLAHGGRERVRQFRDGYLQWADRVEAFLTRAFTESPVLDLHSPRYWHIHQLEFGSARPDAVIGNEITFQADRLQRMAEDLEERVRRLAAPGHIVVPDTNVFLHFHTFGRSGWTEVVGERPARMVIPYRVVRELDEKKASRRRDLAKRATRVLQSLEAALGLSTEPTEIGEGVSLEILYERPSTATTADDEILNACLTLRAYAGPRVTLLTGDVSMRLRARTLDVPALSMPDHLRISAEPPLEDDKT